MSNIFVGVDAGGSGTTVGASGGDGHARVLTGEPANLRTLGAAEAAKRVAALVRKAIDAESPACIVAGVAGAWSTELALQAADELRKAFPRTPVEVVSDVCIALRAAVPEGDALLLLAGTGSVAYAEVGDRRARVGGYGYALGDEGSGYAIGAAALRLLLRAFDDRAPRDAMLDAVAVAADAACPADVLDFIGGVALQERVASVAPIVVEAADRGERSASKIVQAAALDLFELVRALVKNAGVAGRELPLVFQGGLLRRNSLLTYLLETRVTAEFPLLQIIKNSPEPWEGALAMAHALK
ncbi:MAG TPA: BadF/BadG/BcrA/BcrD ATPase family protein [Verrucomicrobiae bacterium]|nr:BadF/BadG/BcrA/BcrD ATPase family protein [Verrucomicrobiae bacterium]